MKALFYQWTKSQGIFAQAGHLRLFEKLEQVKQTKAAAGLQANPARSGTHWITNSATAATALKKLCSDKVWQGTRRFKEGIVPGMAG